MPEELKQLLSSNQDTTGFQAEIVMPEYETKLDGFKGKGRNHDLIVVGKVEGKKTLISVEAKVDESFGEIVSDYVNKSREVNPRSKVPDRVEQLSRALFGDKDTGSFMYQLIHAAAGTLIEAKEQGAEQAVFVVHQFVSTRMNNIKALQNKADFVEFVKLLVGVKLRSYCNPWRR